MTYKLYRAIIITASDKAYKGERIDESGAVLQTLLEQEGLFVVRRVILPDEREQLAKEMKHICDTQEAELIVTTGGTGFSLRDCTPEATLDIAHRQVPGVAEAMRMESMKLTSRAMLSRGVSVIRHNTWIVNLPGSPKAVKENFAVLAPVLQHGLDILKGTATECAQKGEMT